jgi:hypothetical protein
VVTAVAPKAVSTNANRSRVMPSRWREASYAFLREPDNAWQNRRQASTFPARMGNVRTIPDIWGLYFFRLCSPNGKNILSAWPLDNNEID